MVHGWEASAGAEVRRAGADRGERAGAHRRAPRQFLPRNPRRESQV